MVLLNGSLLVLIIAFMCYLNLDFRITVIKKLVYVDRVLDWLQGAKPQENPYLNGNFGPQRKEIFESNLKVSFGKIPSEIDGYCVRNGPNPAIEVKSHYHWFDGDGMLHGVRIKNGIANFTNKQIQTVRLQNEKRLGWAATVKIGELKGVIGVIQDKFWKFLMSISPPSLIEHHHSRGTANTATAFHHNRLMALVESESPYELKIGENGELSELGYNDFKGKYTLPFTAHPKIHPKTKELIFFGYSITAKPYCTYAVADENGNIKSTMAINIPDPVMMHDFAITEHYSIIMDLPVVFDPVSMVRNGSQPFLFKKEKGSRFGIFKHGETDENKIKWFSAPSCYIFHSVNAWEEGDNVILFAPRFESFDMETGRTSFDPKDIVNPVLHRWDFNMKTGEVQQREWMNGDDAFTEFGQINQKYFTRKTRYAYLPNVARSNVIAKFDGVTKRDLTNGKLISTVMYPPSSFGGEMMFIPKTGVSYNGEEEEDDGYLGGFVHNEKTDKSSFYIIDTREMKTVAIIDLPQRVPYGFHSSWITGEQILNQKFK